MSLSDNRLFSNRQLLRLIVPLVIEQGLNILVGLADGIMVSSAGEAAISGVSLVDMINAVVLSLFMGLATGGAVVRNALISYEGRYFLLQSGCISELDAANLFKPEQLAKPVMGITGGGAAAEGKIYYIGNATHVCCWDIPAATKR